MTPDHLLRIATYLAESNTGRPRRADLCRAVSTAAILTLATASGFDTSATLAVQVVAAAHSGSGNVSTGAVALAPTDEASTLGSAVSFL